MTLFDILQSLTRAQKLFSEVQSNMRELATSLRPFYHFLKCTVSSLALVVSLYAVICTFQLQDLPLLSTRPANTSAQLSMAPPPHRIACHPHGDEALSDRCVFDEMLNGWVPVECYNEALAKESLRNDTQLAMMEGSGPFPWYSDLKFTAPLPSSDLPVHLLKPSTNMTAYTLEKWHVAHCLYVWRLGLDAMNRVNRGEDKTYVNIRVLDEGHVNHCNMVVANQDHRRGAKATVTFGFGTCVLMA